ncbi:alpha/beta hydrolase [Alkalihalobacillus pseudalcaliphilus]|uniref:alpha/beta hydrolase n=1 Tax=Alkalihalobacillus pseudalcaliphilus TaxID=79884 RepID=UPI000A7AEFF7|nr:hypothetical protein [Alkalihalobacillus pseudalcaliphilus]
MSVPFKKSIESLEDRFVIYAEAYQKLMREPVENIDRLKKAFKLSLITFQTNIDSTMEQLDKISKPILIMYGELDEKLYKESGLRMVTSLNTKTELKGYKNSHHLMTSGKDRDLIQKDILNFLNGLKW